MTSERLWSVSALRVSSFARALGGNSRVSRPGRFGSVIMMASDQDNKGCEPDGHRGNGNQRPGVPHRVTLGPEDDQGEGADRIDAPMVSQKVDDGLDPGSGRRVL